MLRCILTLSLLLPRNKTDVNESLGSFKVPILDYLFNFWDGYAFPLFIGNKYKYYTKRIFLQSLPSLRQCLAPIVTAGSIFLSFQRSLVYVKIKSENNTNSVISDFSGHQKKKSVLESGCLLWFDTNGISINWEFVRRVEFKSQPESESAF